MARPRDAGSPLDPEELGPQHRAALESAALSPSSGSQHEPPALRGQKPLGGSAAATVKGEEMQIFPQGKSKGKKGNTSDLLPQERGWAEIQCPESEHLRVAPPVLRSDSALPHLATHTTAFSSVRPGRGVMLGVSVQSLRREAPS